MKKTIFKQVGLVYIPHSIIAYFILSGFILYAVYLFIDIDRRSHSVSDTLIHFGYNLVLLMMIYHVLLFLVYQIQNLFLTSKSINL